VKVRYHPDARAELLAAADWYEDRRVILGQDFQAEVRRAEAMIADRPAAWPHWAGVNLDVRRFVLARFPYRLAFQVAGDTIIVIAVAHQSRAPFYWRDRAR
jgi:plasmid stabilization system protein ParE